MGLLVRVCQLRSRSSRQLARGRLVPPPLLNGEDEDDGLTLKVLPPTIPCIPMTFMMMGETLGGSCTRIVL